MLHSVETGYGDKWCGAKPKISKSNVRSKNVTLYKAAIPVLSIKVLGEGVMFFRSQRIRNLMYFFF